MMIRKSRRGCVSFLAVFSCLLAFTSFAEGAVKRVTVNGGIAPRDGNSWEKAFSVEEFRNIHAMTPDAEFWLAAGVYAPGTALQRDNSFFLASGTSIYGGFAGNETSRDQRDPRTNILNSRPFYNEVCGSMPNAARISLWDFVASTSRFLYLPV